MSQKTKKEKKQNYEAMGNERKFSLKKKIFIAISIVLTLAILAGSVYFVIQNLKPDTTESGMEQTVYRGMIESYIQGNGMTSANKREELGKNLEGVVTEVLVKPGDSVLAGDLLLRVDPEVISKKLNDELDKYDEAVLALNNATSQLNSLNVVAPFTGKVVKVLEEGVGTQVTEGTVYATIVDDSKMTLSTYFSYGYIDDIKAGQTALVSIPATTSNITGTVISIEKVQKISPEDGTVLFKVNIQIDNPGTLTKDMLATASITTAKGELFPAESGSLDYLKTQDIILKASGELIYKNVNEHYLYQAGDKLGTLENDSLINDINSKKREVETLQKSVDELRILLVDTELRSPIDGQVSQVSVSVDDEITSGSSTIPITIANLDSLYVDIKISEIDITKAVIGMPVTISYESTDGVFMLEAVLSNLSLEAERSNDGRQGPITYFPGKVTIDNPQDLFPDMNIKYRMTAAQKDNVLIAPVSAVVVTDNGPSLYVKKGSVPGVETFPIIDESIPEGYEAITVEIGISDGYVTEIITEIPDETPIFVPNSSLQPQGNGFDDFGGGGNISVATMG